MATMGKAPEDPADLAAWRAEQRAELDLMAQVDPDLANSMTSAGDLFDPSTVRFLRNMKDPEWRAGWEQMKRDLEQMRQTQIGMYQVDAQRDANAMLERVASAVTKVEQAVVGMDRATRRAQTIGLVLAAVATLAAIVSVVLAVA